MAKLERTLYGDFSAILAALDSAIMNNNASASFEDGSDMAAGCSRCSVRVYERYSIVGQNRVSMNITLLTDGSGASRLSVITSGGSQAVFFKLNTLGEQSFLNSVNDVIEQFSR